MKPSLIVTVDTELTWFPDAQGLWGRVGGRECGLRHILEVFRVLEIRGTFFLDVYGKDEKDVNEQRRAGEMVVGKGQDLQLHTHPAPAFDTYRHNLNDYTLDEQIEILEFGRERIEKWTGQRPSLHRAGSWAANNETLEALKRLGFAADLSACLWGGRCGIERKSIVGNGWTRINDMLCGVGTCYRDRLTGRVRRLDIGGCSFGEVKEVLDKRIQTLFITLHSFSFLKYNKNRTRFGYAAGYVDRFRAFCELARNKHGYEIISAREAVDRMSNCPDRHLIWEELPVSGYAASATGIIKSAIDRLSP
jgi:hypothetical protein